MLFLNFSSIHIKTNYRITILSAEALLFPAKVTGQCVVSKETPQLPRPGGRSAGVTQAAAELRCSPKLTQKTEQSHFSGVLGRPQLSEYHPTFILPILACNSSGPTLLEASLLGMQRKTYLFTHNHGARKTPDTPTAKRCIQEALGQKELRFLGNGKNKE